MKYKELKIVEKITKSTTGYGDPPDDLCRSVTNIMAKDDEGDKILARQSVKDFLSHHPEWTDYLNACLQGKKGDGNLDTPGIGPGTGKVGDGSSSGNKGDGKGGGDGKGTGKGNKTGDGTGKGDDKGAGTGNIPGFTPPSDGSKKDGKPGGKNDGGAASDLVGKQKEFGQAIKDGDYEKAQGILDANPELKNVIDKEVIKDLEKALNPPVVKPDKKMIRLIKKMIRLMIKQMILMMKKKTTLIITSYQIK